MGNYSMGPHSTGVHLVYSVEVTTRITIIVNNNLPDFGISSLTTGLLELLSTLHCT